MEVVRHHHHHHHHHLLLLLLLLLLVAIRSLETDERPPPSVGILSCVPRWTTAECDPFFYMYFIVLMGNGGHLAVLTSVNLSSGDVSDTVSDSWCVS